MTDHDARPDTTPAPEPAKKSDVYEIIATVLLGIATVAIAWSANQSNLWSGIQDKRLAESVRVDNDSVDAFQNADSVRQLDQLLFIELLGEVDASDTGLSERAEEILNNMSPGGEEVALAWAEGEIDFPFENEAYLDDLYAEGTELKAEGDALYDEGVEANTNGDNYVLASTMMASVLFFAGISMVLSGTRTRQVLLTIATIALVGSIGYMLTLPVA